MINAAITGTGFYCPPKVVTNFDLEKIVETSNDWIVERTGIHQRHIAEDDVFTSDMCAEAAKKAIEKAGLTPADIDMIFVATLTGDMQTPSTACIVQSKIGAVNSAAMDVNAACAGFLYAVNTATQFIKCGIYKNILIIGSENLSKVTDWQDRATCVLFGDGAGAVVLSATDKDCGVRTFTMGADGTMGHVLTICNLKQDPEELEKRVSKNPKTLWMDGSEVFKFAVRIMVSASNKALEQAGLTMDDIDLIIPHQANIRIIDGAVRRMKVSPDKVFSNIHNYGNMSAASIPVALCEAVEQGKIKSGSNVLMVGFGAGLTWAATIIKWI